MRSVRLWVPESEYDRVAVCCIAQKILVDYKCDVKIDYATKQAYNDAVRKPNGLKKAVDIYLKNNDLVVFLIDADGRQLQSQRRTENNSLLNRIEEVVRTSNGRAKVILMVQELEAWLLVDCIGICCYFTGNHDLRKDPKWIKFAERKQIGKTDTIAEAELGGKGVKEHLQKLSREILIEINPKLKDKLDNLKKRQYTESESGKIAEFLEITYETITRNDSLEEFAQCLKQLCN